MYATAAMQAMPEVMQYQHHGYPQAADITDVSMIEAAPAEVNSNVICSFLILISSWLNVSVPHRVFLISYRPAHPKILISNQRYLAVFTEIKRTKCRLFINVYIEF